MSKKKTDGEVLKEYCEMKEIKGFHYKRCTDCAKPIKLTICSDDALRTAPSCYCHMNKVIRMTWDEVAKLKGLKAL